jgi:serine O-acetyltransferase
VNKKTYGNDLWDIITKEADRLKSSDPELEDFLEKNIFSYDNLFDSVTNILTNKLSDKEDSVSSLRELISIALSSEIIQLSIEEDINSVFEKDPACRFYCQPLLFFKGFQALQAHRVANHYWKKKIGTSLFIQSKVSELFNIDIHPAAKIGKGIMIDHASGLVIGETAVVGDDCSIFHGVSLGGIGSEEYDRHPKVGKNVLLAANSTILGNIKIGDNVKIGAGSVVISDIPENSTAVGVPARILEE